MGPREWSWTGSAYGIPPGGTRNGGCGLLPPCRSSESLELKSDGSESGSGFGGGEGGLGDGVLTDGVGAEAKAEAEVGTTGEDCDL